MSCAVPRSGLVALSAFLGSVAASATPAGAGIAGSSDPTDSRQRASYLLHWDALEGCPSTAELRRKLDELSVPGGRDSPLRIDAEVRPSGGQLRLELQLSDEPPRYFDAQNCPVLAETLVVLSAVALGSTPPPSPAPASTGDSARQDQAKRATSTGPTKHAIPSKQPASDQTPTGPNLQFEAAVGTTTSFGYVGAVGTPLSEAAVRYRIKFLSAGLRTSIAASNVTQRVRLDAGAVLGSATLHLRRWTLGPEICGGGRVGPEHSAWEAWGCLDLGASTWFATADGLVSSTSQRSNLWSVGAAIRAGWRFTQRWILIAGARIERPLHRLDWAARDSTSNSIVSLRETPELGVSWTLGLAYAF